MGGFVTLCRHGCPFLERRISDRLDPLPTLHAFRPADFSPLITGVSHRVIRNRVKPAFLLSNAEYVLIHPVLETESERPSLGRFGCQRFLRFKKSRAAVVENLG